MDVDIEGDDVDMVAVITQPRSPTPEMIMTASVKRVSKRKEAVGNLDRSSRKRIKKKSAVYSDEDADIDDDFEFEVEMRKQMEDKDVDDDFMPASPPPPTKRVAGKKAAATSAGKKGKPKRGGSKGADLVIAMKDERKITTSTSATSVTEAVVISGSSSTLAGTKKRRDTTDVVHQQPAADSAGESQKTVVDSVTSPDEPKPAPVKKKLPPIKKNKSLASTAPSSGPSTPSGPSSLAAKAIVNSAARKTANATGRPPTTQAADVNLSDSNVYNMLFKASGSSTPRVGVNVREERRKELDRMRDQAREQRMADLKKSTFDLLASQEKVSGFEIQMRSRNSPALYPAHMGTVFKILMQEKQKQA